MSVILGMCAGRWGRNGSSQRRKGSPKLGVVEIVVFIWGFRPRESPNIGTTIKKNPITLPIDCYLDYERHRYFEKIANALAFWRQKRQKPLNSYGFSYFLRQELGFVRGSAPGEGPGQLPKPPLRPSRVKVTSRVTAPSKINENR